MKQILIVRIAILSLLSLIFYIHVNSVSAVNFSLEPMYDEVSLDVNGFEADQEIYLPLAIHNEGSTEDNITIGLKDEITFLSVSFDNQTDTVVTLEPDEEVNVSIFISIDGKAELGIIPVEIVGESSNRTQIVQINVTVFTPHVEISEHDIVISHLDTLAPGDTTSITVRIWNNGTSEIEDISVTLLIDNEFHSRENLRSIREGRGEVLGFEWRNISGGDHELRLLINNSYPSNLTVVLEVNIPELQTNDDNNRDPEDLKPERVILPIIVAFSIIVILSILLFRKK